MNVNTEEELLIKIQHLENQLELERARRDALNTALSISCRLAADIKSVLLKSEGLSIMLTYDEFCIEFSGNCISIRTPNFYYRLVDLKNADEFYTRITHELQCRASTVELDRLIPNIDGTFTPFQYKKVEIFMDKAKDGLYF